MAHTMNHNQRNQVLKDKTPVPKVQRTEQIELFEESEDDEEPEKPKGENIMLRPYFRANFKAGYWEAVFFHTKPLGVVPADMRAR